MPGVRITYTLLVQSQLDGIMRALGIDLPESKATFKAELHRELRGTLNAGLNETPPRIYKDVNVQVVYRPKPSLKQTSRWFAVTLIPPALGGFEYLVTSVNYATTTERSRTSGARAIRALAASPPGPVAVFQGYDTFSGAGQATAVGGASSPTDPQTTNHWTVCTDFSSVSTSLSIDSSVSDDEFLVASTSVNAAFANSLHLTKYSVTILVNCASLISSEATSYSLLPTVTLPTDKPSLAQFVATYGDQFVASITTGVQLLAAYVFYCTSIDEQTTVTAQLKAQDLDEDGEIDSAFGTRLSKVTQSVATRQAFTAQLLGLNSAPPSSAADIWPFLPQINAANVTPGYVASVTTKLYEDVGLLGVINEYGPNLISNRALYGILNGYLTQLDVLQNQLGAIEDAYFVYAYSGDTKVTERVAQLELDLENVTGLIDDIMGAPLQSPPAVTIPQPASLDGTVPMLSFDLIPGPVWGGENGIGNRITYFDPSIVLGANALTEVTINGGDEVNYLILSYGDLEPLHLGAPDSGGKGSQTITLQTQQFIQSATATAGYVVNSLTLTTTTDTLLWPQDARGAEQMPTWTPSAGTVLAGFSGSYDTSDSQHTWTLQPVAVQFSPAVWLSPPVTAPHQARERVGVMAD